MIPVKSFLLLAFFLIAGCEKYPVTTEIIYATAGKAGQQTPVPRNTEGNIFGYYEYLPKNFGSRKDSLYPVVFYWNGKNAIKGDGRKELKRVLRQGLSKYIHEGKHYNAIVITPQLYKNDWKTLDVDPFISYVLKRYKQYIDMDRVYMTGFSAGGGLTIKYALAHAEKLAAIIPVSPAIRYADESDKNTILNNMGVWLFHNRGDKTIDFKRSVSWYEVLSKDGNKHRMTLYDKKGHYAWKQAYKEEDLWKWLLSQKKQKLSSNL